MLVITTRMSGFLGVFFRLSKPTKHTMAALRWEVNIASAKSLVNQPKAT